MMNKLAFQLYSVRDCCQTEKDLDKTLAKLKEFGYEGAQISAIGPIEPEKVRNLFDKHGLVCCAAHDNLNNIVQHTKEVIQRQKNYGCDFIALGHPGPHYYKEGGAKELAALLEKAGEEAANAGIRLGYHNHADEFEKFAGKTFFWELYDNTSPRFLYAEPDTHWIQRGGANPASVLERLGKRAPIVHLKDMAFVQGQPHICEIGQGNLEWPAILQLCRKLETEWLVVEQDTPFNNRDMFESAKMSFNYLKECIKILPAQ